MLRRFNVTISKYFWGIGRVQAQYFNANTAKIGIPFIFSLCFVRHCHTSCDANYCSNVKTTIQKQQYADIGKIENPVLQSIKFQNQLFVNDPECVYISCMDTNPKKDRDLPEGKWLIIAKKNQNTKTTEKDNDVNNVNGTDSSHEHEPESTKKMHMAHELDVVQIIDMDTGTTIESLGPISCNMIKWTTKYLFTVGKQTVRSPDKYSNDNDPIDNMDLCYFKTIEHAFFYQKCIPSFYSGTWIHVNRDGNLEGFDNYENGLLHGKSTRFSDDKIIDETWFQNGKLDGPSRHYYNGTLARYDVFKNGKSVGPHIIFRSDGRLWFFRDNTGYIVDNSNNTIQ